MKFQKWLLTLVLLLTTLALAAGSVLAQDATPPESAGPTGLRVGFLLVGLGALFFLFLLKREPVEDTDS